MGRFVSAHMMGILASSSLHEASMSEDEKAAELERDAQEKQEYYRILQKEAKMQSETLRSLGSVD